MFIYLFILQSKRKWRWIKRTGKVWISPVLLHPLPGAEDKLRALIWIFQLKLEIWDHVISGPGGDLVILTGIYAPTHRQARNRRIIKIPAAYSLIVIISVPFLLVVRFFYEPCILLLPFFKNKVQNCFYSLINLSWF